MATSFHVAGLCPSASQFLNDDFQRGLARWNRERLSPQMIEPDWADRLVSDQRMLRLAGAFLEELRHEIAAKAAEAPDDAESFLTWFELLKVEGPDQGDPLFPWLAAEASTDALRLFVEQEAAGEAGFDDLVAYTQIKLPSRPKLELARNYWDEMGRGNAKGMHGPMRSEERRVGKESGSKCRSRWWQDN